MPDKKRVIGSSGFLVQQRKSLTQKFSGIKVDHTKERKLTEMLDNIVEGMELEKMIPTLTSNKNSDKSKVSFKQTVEKSIEGQTLLEESQKSSGSEKDQL